MLQTFRLVLIHLRCRVGLFGEVEVPPVGQRIVELISKLCRQTCCTSDETRKIMIKFACTRTKVQQTFIWPNHEPGLIVPTTINDHIAELVLPSLPTVSTWVHSSGKCVPTQVECLYHSNCWAESVFTVRTVQKCIYFRMFTIQLKRKFSRENTYSLKEL